MCTYLKFGEIALHQGDCRAAENYLAQAMHCARLDSYVGAPANVLGEQAVLAIFRGDYTRACACCEEARSLFLEMGHRANTAWAEAKWGLALLLQGRAEEAERFFCPALETYRQVGDRRHIVYLLHDRAVAAALQGRTALAWTFLEEALIMARQIRHSRGTALVLGRLGRLMLEVDNLDGARAMLVESLALRQQISDPRMIAEGLRIAALTLAEGDPAVAAQKLGAAYVLREQIGAPLPPLEQDAFDHLTHSVASSLGLERFDQEREHGISEVFGQFSFDSLSD